MFYQKKNFSRVLTLSLAAVMAAGVLASTTSQAAAATEPMGSTGATTVAAHRAAEPTALILGGELVTIGNDTKVGTTVKTMEIFGSDKNTSPSAYLYNYDNGFTSSSFCAALITGTFGPQMAEITVSKDADGNVITDGDGNPVLISTSVTMNPDYYLGVAANGGYTYTNMGVAASKQVAYNSSDLSQMIDTMYTLAEKITTNRYSNTSATDIAKDYEAYVKETQLYVLSKIADGTVSKKKVAILGDSVVKNGITYYRAFKYTTPRGQLAYRTDEYLRDTTTNIVSTLADGSYLTELDTNGNTVYLLTADQVKNADVIVSMGIQLTPGLSSSDITALKNAGVPESKIITGTPLTAYGILMNSVDNALGVGILNSVVYPEILDVEDAVAYYYSHIYHVKDTEIDSLTDDEYADTNGTRYSWFTPVTDANVSTCKADYATVLQAGYNYYVSNIASFNGTRLALSEHLYTPSED